jgi:hypothetical protein
MGNGFTGAPAVDFYSQLSGLGDTIAANRAAQAKRDAFAAATMPGADGKIDYGRAILGLAQVDPQAAALFAQRQNHEDTLKQQAIESARNAANDKFNHGISAANLEIARKNLENNSEGPEEVTAQRLLAAKTIGLQPGTPEHTQYLANGSIPESGASKPVPFETLGGTKFMVKGPNGYTIVDPSSLASPGTAPIAPAAAIPAPVAAPPQAGAPAPAPVAPPSVVSPAPAEAMPSAAPPSAPPVASADLTAIDPKTGRREDWLKGQPADVQAYIKKIADYEIDPRTTSIKGGHREQVLSAVAQYDPTYDQNSFGSRAKAMRDFATGTQGNAIRSFDVAIDHLDTLQKYATALKSGDVRVINHLRNAWLAETGSPLPTNIQAVAPIVGAEVSKAIIGSNNALADREELRKPLALANSPEQLTGAIEGYKALMGGQLKGLKKQYEDTTGKKDFDKRIRENTKNVLIGEPNGGGVGQPNVTTSGVKWSIQ